MNGIHRLNGSAQASPPVPMAEVVSLIARFAFGFYIDAPAEVVTIRFADGQTFRHPLGSLTGASLLANAKEGGAPAFEDVTAAVRSWAPVTPVRLSIRWGDGQRFACPFPVERGVDP